ncbi:uncharacterized protein FFMR_10204 [Fusarium fujikuroi]|nr:uncharacterized protein FFMR_10204 [Fusarium fujikuroi]VTT68969.1 unnamed protein product [Fusarium fujikuroi]
MESLYKKFTQKRQRDDEAMQLAESIDHDDIPIPHDFEVEPFGLFILSPSPEIYQPSAECDVDIIAIHGLNGSAKKTWTDSTTGNCWLEDLLPESIPRCRVMTFGYDSKLAFSKSRSGVEAFAQDLLNRLRVVRSSPEARNRPLMFIAHSLGGIVVKKALIMAHNGSEVYSPILKATTGIVFLGTPHRGSDLASWGILLSNLVSVTSMGKNIRKELLRTLSKDSDTLAEISKQFLQRAKSLKIMSFIEQQVESPLATLVVPEYSAIMGLPNETVLPMNAHHRGLTRFPRKTDQNYMLVEAAIREVAYKERDVSHVVEVPGDIEMSRLYWWLEKEVGGLKYVMSFKFKGQTGDIGLEWEDIFTTPVEITSGRPSYNRQKGLEINAGQTIASFMSKAFPHPITAKLHGSSQEGDRIFDKVSGSILQVGQDDTPDLVVSFMRTVRVPESDKEYDLPPGLGTFPLFNIAPFSHILPPSMVAKGGFFLPMYQMEALWIHFHTEGQKRFAIRPYVGGINGLSGESSEGGMASILRQMNPANRKQNYIVLPEQLWLDGIATAPGVVKQFVATEMAPPRTVKSQGSRVNERSQDEDASSDHSIHTNNPEGASIEWQLTGRDEVGGLQLQIIPAFEPDQIHAGSNRNAYKMSRSDVSDSSLPTSEGCVFDVLSTPAELNMKEGQTIHVKDLKSLAPSRPKVVSDLIDEASLKRASQGVVELDAVLNSYSEWVFVIKLLGSPNPPPILLHFGDGDSFDCILKIVAKELQTSRGWLAIEYSAANNAQGWISISSCIALDWLPRLTGEIHTLARRCEFTFDTILECFPILKGGGGLSVRVYYNGKEWHEKFSDGDSIAELKMVLVGKTGIAVKEQIFRCEGKLVQDNEDLCRYLENLLTLTTHETTAPTTLGLGAGGKILQHIKRDTNDPRIWDLSSSRIIIVQFQDARSFRLVTGHAPPETPITADIYAQMGLSFFKLYGDEYRAVNDVSEGWGSVMGVAEVVRRKAKKGKDLSSTDVTTRNEEEWGLLHTGAWGLLKCGSRVMQTTAGDRDFEYPAVVLNVDSTVPAFTSILEEE